MGRTLWVLICVCICAGLASADPVAGRFAYVADFPGGRVIKFNLQDGTSQEVVTLKPDNPVNSGDRPRGVAVDSQGRIYVGLRGGTRNVKRFAADGTFIDDFTASIGGFGTGLIAFDSNGDLIVAGDVSNSSSVFRYDGTTGALIDSFNLGGFTNVVGLAVHGDFVYSAALFSGNVARYDLTGAPVSGIPFVNGGGLLNRPIGMTVGHNGNLFVSSSFHPRILEFDINSGAFVGTFLDLGPMGLAGVVDLHYDDVSGHYFLTRGDSLFEFTSTGILAATFTSNILQEAYGLTVVTSPGAAPEPSSLLLALTAVAFTFAFAAHRAHR